MREKRVRGGRRERGCKEEGDNGLCSVHDWSHRRDCFFINSSRTPFNTKENTYNALKASFKCPFKGFLEGFL